MMRLPFTAARARCTLVLAALVCAPAWAGVDAPTQININLTYSMTTPTCTVKNLDQSATPSTQVFSTGLPENSFTQTVALQPISFTACQSATKASMTFGTTADAVSGAATLFKIPNGVPNYLAAGFQLEYQPPGGNWTVLKPGDAFNVVDLSKAYNFRYSIKHVNTLALVAGDTYTNVVVKVSVQ